MDNAGFELTKATSYEDSVLLGRSWNLAMVRGDIEGLVDVVRNAYTLLGVKVVSESVMRSDVVRWNEGLAKFPNRILTGTFRLSVNKARQSWKVTPDVKDFSKSDSMKPSAVDPQAPVVYLSNLFRQVFVSMLALRRYQKLLSIISNPESVDQGLASIVTEAARADLATIKSKLTSTLTTLENQWPLILGEIAKLDSAEALRLQNEWKTSAHPSAYVSQSLEMKFPASLDSLVQLPQINAALKAQYATWEADLTRVASITNVSKPTLRHEAVNISPADLDSKGAVSTAPSAVLIRPDQKVTVDIQTLRSELMDVVSTIVAEMKDGRGTVSAQSIDDIIRVSTKRMVQPPGVSSVDSDDFNTDVSKRHRSELDAIKAISNATFPAPTLADEGDNTLQQRVSDAVEQVPVRSTPDSKMSVAVSASNPSNIPADVTRLSASGSDAISSAVVSAVVNRGAAFNHIRPLAQRPSESLLTVVDVAPPSNTPDLSVFHPVIVPDSKLSSVIAGTTAVEVAGTNSLASRPLGSHVSADVSTPADVASVLASAVAVGQNLSVANADPMAVLVASQSPATAASALTVVPIVVDTSSTESRLNKRKGVFDEEDTATKKLSEEVREIDEDDLDEEEDEDEYDVDGYEHVDPENPLSVVSQQLAQEQKEAREESRRSKKDADEEARAYNDDTEEPNTPEKLVKWCIQFREFAKKVSGVFERHIMSAAASLEHINGNIVRLQLGVKDTGHAYVKEYDPSQKVLHTYMLAEPTIVQIGSKELDSETSDYLTKNAKHRLDPAETYVKWVSSVVLINTDENMDGYGEITIPSFGTNSFINTGSGFLERIVARGNGVNARYFANLGDREVEHQLHGYFVNGYFNSVSANNQYLVVGLKSVGAIAIYKIPSQPSDRPMSPWIYRVVQMTDSLVTDTGESLYTPVDIDSILIVCVAQKHRIFIRFGPFVKAFTIEDGGSAFGLNKLPLQTADCTSILNAYQDFSRAYPLKDVETVVVDDMEQASLNMISHRTLVPGFDLDLAPVALQNERSSIVRRIYLTPQQFIPVINYVPDEKAGNTQRDFSEVRLEQRFNFRVMFIKLAGPALPRSYFSFQDKFIEDLITRYQSDVLRDISSVATTLVTENLDKRSGKAGAKQDTIVFRYWIAALFASHLKTMSNSHFAAPRPSREHVFGAIYNALFPENAVSLSGPDTSPELRFMFEALYENSTLNVLLYKLASIADVNETDEAKAPPIVLGPELLIGTMQRSVRVPFEGFSSFTYSGSGKQMITAWSGSLLQVYMVQHNGQELKLDTISYESAMFELVPQGIDNAVIPDGTNAKEVDHVVSIFMEERLLLSLKSSTYRDQNDPTTLIAGLPFNKSAAEAVLVRLNDPATKYAIAGQELESLESDAEYLTDRLNKGLIAKNVATARLAQIEEKRKDICDRCFLFDINNKDLMDEYCVKLHLAIAADMRGLIDAESLLIQRCVSIGLSNHLLAKKAAKVLDIVRTGKSPTSVYEDAHDRAAKYRLASTSLKELERLYEEAKDNGELVADVDAELTDISWVGYFKQFLLVATNTKIFVYETYPATIELLRKQDAANMSKTASSAAGVSAYVPLVSGRYSNVVSTFSDRPSLEVEIIASDSVKQELVTLLDPKTRQLVASTIGYVNNDSYRQHGFQNALRLIKVVDFGRPITEVHLPLRGNLNTSSISFTFEPQSVSSLVYGDLFTYDSNRPVNGFTYGSSFNFAVFVRPDSLTLPNPVVPDRRLYVPRVDSMIEIKKQSYSEELNFADISVLRHQYAPNVCRSFAIGRAWFDFGISWEYFNESSSRLWRHASQTYFNTIQRYLHDSWWRTSYRMIESNPPWITPEQHKYQLSKKTRGSILSSLPNFNKKFKINAAGLAALHDKAPTEDQLPAFVMGIADIRLYRWYAKDSIGLEEGYNGALPGLKTIEEMKGKQKDDDDDEEDDEETAALAEDSPYGFWFQPDKLEFTQKYLGSYPLISKYQSQALSLLSERLNRDVDDDVSDILQSLDTLWRNCTADYTERMRETSPSKTKSENVGRKKTAPTRMQASTSMPTSSSASVLSSTGDNEAEFFGSVASPPKSKSSAPAESKTSLQPLSFIPPTESKSSTQPLILGSQSGSKSSAQPLLVPRPTSSSLTSQAAPAKTAMQLEREQRINEAKEEADIKAAIAASLQAPVGGGLPPPPPLPPSDAEYDRLLLAEEERQYQEEKKRQESLPVPVIEIEESEDEDFEEPAETKKKKKKKKSADGDEAEKSSKKKKKKDDDDDNEPDGATDGKKKKKTGKKAAKGNSSSSSSSAAPVIAPPLSPDSSASASKKVTPKLSFDFSSAPDDFFSPTSTVQPKLSSSSAVVAKKTSSSATSSAVVAKKTSSSATSSAAVMKNSSSASSAVTKKKSNVAFVPAAKKSRYPALWTSLELPPEPLTANAFMPPSIVSAEHRSNLVVFLQSRNNNHGPEGHDNWRVEQALLIETPKIAAERKRQSRIPDDGYLKASDYLGLGQEGGEVRYPAVAVPRDISPNTPFADIARLVYTRTEMDYDSETTNPNDPLGSADNPIEVKDIGQVIGREGVMSIRSPGRSARPAIPHVDIADLRAAYSELIVRMRLLIPDLPADPPGGINQPSFIRYGVSARINFGAITEEALDSICSDDDPTSPESVRTRRDMCTMLETFAGYISQMFQRAVRSFPDFRVIYRGISMGPRYQHVPDNEVFLQEDMDTFHEEVHLPTLLEVPIEFVPIIWDGELDSDVLPDPELVLQPLITEEHNTRRGLRIPIFFTKPGGDMKEWPSTDTISAARMGDLYMFGNNIFRLPEDKRVDYMYGADIPLIHNAIRTGILHNTRFSPYTGEHEGKLTSVYHPLEVTYVNAEEDGKIVWYRTNLQTNSILWTIAKSILSEQQLPAVQLPPDDPVVRRNVQPILSMERLAKLLPPE